MKRFLARSILTLGVLLAVVYAGDYISIAYQIPRGRQQFGSVEVQKLLAVPLKDRKTEFFSDKPQEQQCAYSLFPQLGLQPCWYLSRHTMQQVNY